MLDNLAAAVEVSVIIVNYCTPAFTEQAIRSVKETAQGIRTEIIVVDNASEDDSLERIRHNWDGEIVLHANSSNAGFAQANNIAMRMANGKYYLLLNSDAELMEKALAQMLAYMENHSEVGILGCTILSDNGEQQASCWRPPSLSWLFLRALGLYRVLPDGWFGSTHLETYGKPTAACSVAVVSGCVMLVRRSAAQEVGLFDERFFMYSEDTEWCTRMQKKGYQIHFIAEAKVKHFGGGTSAGLFDKMKVEQMRSILQYIGKERGYTATHAANFFMVLFFILRLPGWCFMYVVNQRRKQAKQMIQAYVHCIRWHLSWPFRVGYDSLLARSKQ